MLTEHAELETQRIVARKAVLAVPTADARVDQDGVSDRDSRHPRADGIDDSHAVRAKYPWRYELDAGSAQHRPEVDVVECGRAQSNPNVGRRRDHRLRDVAAKTQLFKSTMRVNRERSHHS